MRPFGFDLLPYPERLDHVKVDGELPYAIRSPGDTFGRRWRSRPTASISTPGPGWSFVELTPKRA